MYYSLTKSSMKKIHFILIAILFLFATQASAVSFTTNEALRRGSSGVDVLTLQQFLVSEGYLAGEIDGTFGVKTETAVKAFQFAQGLGADGVVGKDTKLRITGGQVLGVSTLALSTTQATAIPVTTTTSSATTTIATTSDIKEFKDPLLCNGVYLNVKRATTSPTEDIQSGDESENIAIFSLKTGACSVKIISADFIIMNIDSEGPTFDNINVIGGTSWDSSGADPYERTTATFENFTIPANSEKTITINLEDIVADGSVDHNAIAGGLLGLKGVFSSGSAFKIETGGVWGHVLDVKGGTTEPAEAGLEISSSVNTPDEGIVEVDQDDETEGVPLLVFELEAIGNITLESLPVRIHAETNSSATYIASEYFLREYGSQEALSAEYFTTGGNDDPLIVTFDDIDLEIEDGDTMLLGVFADIHGVDDNYEEGDSLIASITDDEVEEIDAEDADGNTIDEDDLIGSALGKTQTFYTEGIIVEIEEIDVEKTFTADQYGEVDQGTFTFEYNITAFGMDVVIDKSCKEDGTDIPDQGTEYYVLMNTSNTTACGIASTAPTAGNDSGSWIIEEGETESFTLTVLVVPTIDQNTSVSLESINWDDTSDTSPDRYMDAPAITVPVLFLNKL